jgi:arginyl-tRNA synthetase
MLFLDALTRAVGKALAELYNYSASEADLVFNHTRPEFEGDYTLVIFPVSKKTGVPLTDLGSALGEWLVKHEPALVQSWTLEKGFLNLTLSDRFWTENLLRVYGTPDFGVMKKHGSKIMVEFSSPNTNKPLHLGHIRNILLGWSCSKIMEANGYEVIKTQIINDRGIAICKSMLAWQKYGEGKTPESTGIKGDHFVGDYYVLFEVKFQEEYQHWQQSEAAKHIFATHAREGETEAQFFKNFKNSYFNDYSILGSEARKMLLDWEAGDPETIALWKRLNSWVYAGFDETYRKLGVNFDALYYESDTYLLGKDAILSGLEKGVFYRQEDGSVWVNLEDVGMDRKVVLRSDGTAVYITQDIGTAQKRYRDFGIDAMVYTVADEQDYHFKVLFEILKRLGEPYAQHLHHLSYGMVDLPSGKMKSREGTVVDADDLIAEVIGEARLAAAERGELAHLSQTEQDKIIETIALGALKYFIIKVQPKKRMIFDPKESVDMQGNTGPYIQNAYVRIKSILRKQNTVKGLESGLKNQISGEYAPLEVEKTLLKHILDFPELIQQAGRTYDPSLLANYAYQLARNFHRMYHDVRILNAESEAAAAFRLTLCSVVAYILQKNMYLLGIDMPERM